MLDLFKWGMVALASLALVAAIELRYEPDSMGRMMDALPEAYAYFQEGKHYGEGTALPQESKGRIVALSTPKYSQENDSRLYLIGKKTEDAYEVVGNTPPLPGYLDPQAVAVDGNSLIVANYGGWRDSIVIYDLGAAFAGELKVIGRIPYLPRPTGMKLEGGRLYVTCQGGYFMHRQGIYVYEKDGRGSWVQVQRFLYRDVYGQDPLRDDYRHWEELGPSSIAVTGHTAYVANQYSGSVGVMDMTVEPEASVLGRFTGPKTRIYNPLGLAVERGLLFVTEHIHRYVGAFALTHSGGDMPPVRVFSDAGSRIKPYGILADGRHVLVADLKIHGIAVFPADAAGSVPSGVIDLPNGAAITALAYVSHE